jgi:hypothetical protein
VRTKRSRLPSSYLVGIRSTFLYKLVLTSSSKYLYNFSSNTKEPISLESTDTGPLCQCKDVGKDWAKRWSHRRDCHKLSYEAIRLRNDSIGRSTPAMNRKCRTRYATHHCECFTRRNRLHFRLKSWMPSGMNYCGHCEKFTVRKRGHNGRCKLIAHLGEKVLTIQAIMVLRNLGRLKANTGHIHRETVPSEERFGRNGLIIVR